MALEIWKSSAMEVSQTTLFLPGEAVFTFSRS